MFPFPVYLFERVRQQYLDSRNLQPPLQRSQFVALLEQEASEEALQAFTRQHLANIPAFVTQSLQEVRARFRPSEHQGPL
jgi:hypothetical protein